MELSYELFLRGLRAFFVLFVIKTYVVIIQAYPPRARIRASRVCSSTMPPWGQSSSQQ